MRTYVLNAREKRFDASVESLQRHRPEKIKAIHHVPAVDESFYAVCTHELSAVEQSQPLFGFEPDGTPAHLGKHVGTLYAASLEEHLSFPYKREEEIGKRREVS